MKKHSAKHGDPHIDSMGQAKKIRKLDEAQRKVFGKDPDKLASQEQSTLLPLSVQDVQQQMAMMETQGRQEEFVTSAGKLKEDEIKMDKFQANHMSGSGRRVEEQIVLDKHQLAQAQNFYADPNKDNYWKKMTFSSSDKRHYPQHPDAIANSPQKNPQQFVDDRDFHQANQGSQPLSLPDQLDPRYERQMAKFVYEDPSQIGGLARQENMHRETELHRESFRLQSHDLSPMKMDKPPIATSKQQSLSVTQNQTHKERVKNQLKNEEISMSRLSDAHSYDSDNDVGPKVMQKYRFVDENPGYTQLVGSNLEQWTSQPGKSMLDWETKVVEHVISNPISQAFLKREKGRLPYSVFKASNDNIRFLKSMYKGRPPTVFFGYPTYCTVKSNMNQSLIKAFNRRSNDLEPLFFAFHISDRTHIYNAVVNTMKTAGFELLEKMEDFNLLWTGYTQIEDILQLNKYQKVNHFPNSLNLGRKDLLWNNILRLKLKYPHQFNIAPHSWVLPESWSEWSGIIDSKFMQEKMFILKPNASSCGRGIRVVQGASCISNKEDNIVSFYIDRPLLINQKKFDMRVYVVVTSFHPLRVYMYQEGLARFATEEYSNDPNVLRNKFVHLTNFSINKKNQKFVKNEGKSSSGTQLEQESEQNPEQESSSKWSLRFLRKYMTKKFSSEKCLQLFEGCKDVVVKTLISVEPNIVKDLNQCGNRQKCCFEVYGFDIMFDEDLKPWVLEVNCLPSLSSSSMFDKQVKTQLIADTFTLVGFRGYDKLQAKKDVQKDKEKGTYATQSAPSFQMSMTLEEVEHLASVPQVSAEDPEHTQNQLLKQYQGQVGLDNAKEVIMESGTSQGLGPGFNENSQFTRDEFNSILDLEDEGTRLGQFDRIYPLPSTCSEYYAYMEVKRYQNALYCAWLNTASEVRDKILARNMAALNK